MRRRISLTLDKNTIFVLQSIGNENKVSLSKAVDIMAQRYRETRGTELMAEQIAEKVSRLLKEKETKIL